MDFYWLTQQYGDMFAEYDTGVKSDYIILYLILCFCTIIFSRKLSRLKDEKSWFLCMLPYILIFSIIEGVRYLRGTDYLNYALRYLYDEEFRINEFIWCTFRELLHLLHCSYWTQYIVFAFCWITGMIYLIQKDKKYACYVMPIALVFALGSFENLIRQSFAFSFLFVAMSHLLDKKYKYAILFATIAIFIHNAALILVLIIGSIYLIRNYKIKAIVYVILYLIMIVLAQVHFLAFITQKAEGIIHLLGNNISFIAFYLTNFDQWLGSDAFMDKYSRGIITLIFSAIFDITVMALSYSHLKRNHFTDSKLLFFYHLFCISNLLLQLSTNYMIIRRIFTMFYMFIAYLIAYIMKNKPSSKIENIFRFYMLAYVAIFFIKNILLASNQLFLWNAHGKYNLHL